MSTILRTLRNLRKIGIKEYAHQLQNIGDTKAGTYIATDRYGNKYYENLEQELPRASSPILQVHLSKLHDPRWRKIVDPRSSENEMGRLQRLRIRPLANRTGLARMDVVHGR